MYAITVAEPGGPENMRWTEVEDPEPGPGEVLLDVVATAVNRVFRADFSPPAMAVLMRAPTRHEDLGVFASDGALASFCTIWLDEANRAGVFEPVGSHPDHRRRGLGRAVMWEGLQRLREWGATSAAVDTGYRAPAVAFYRAVGFELVEAVDHWRIRL